MIKNRFTVKCSIKSFNHDIQEITSTIQSSDCKTVHLGNFQNGQFYWNPTQGFYTITISIHDSSPYALFSKAYNLVICNPLSLQLKSNQLLSDQIQISKETLQTSGLFISYPSSYQPLSIRWYIDEKDSSSTFYFDLLLILLEKHLLKILILFLKENILSLSVYIQVFMDILIILFIERFL